MLIGTTIMKLDGDWYLSPQFNRGGLAATFACEVQRMVLGVGIALNVEVQHKNSSDTAWMLLGAFGAMAAIGVTTLEGSGIKEQVRFRYKVTGANAYDGVHFLMQAPSWRPY